MFAFRILAKFHRKRGLETKRRLVSKPLLLLRLIGQKLLQNSHRFKMVSGQ